MTYPQAFTYHCPKNVSMFGWLVMEHDDDAHVVRGDFEAAFRVARDPTPRGCHARSRHQGTPVPGPYRGHLMTADPHKARGQHQGRLR